jgi:hypothetical protein
MTAGAIVRRAPVFTAALVVAGLASAALPSADTPAGGQEGARRQTVDRPAVPTGPAPRLHDGTPDLNGVWTVPYVPDMTLNGRNQRGYAEPPFSPEASRAERAESRARGEFAELPFTPAGLADWSVYDAAEGDYTGSCLPFGLMRAVNAPYPVQIVQNEQYVALLFETNTWFHVIPIDGRPPPDDPNPTWFGHSVGHWDGDTLVVDTTGFNGYTRLDTVGHPHSDALHMRQTFRRVDEGHLAYGVTITDPKMYTKPWTNERTFTLSSGELIEYSCEENNRSLWEGRIRRWTPPE